jgi:pimeloyl-ACP methyl ester carboxylesterase
MMRGRTLAGLAVTAAAVALPAPAGAALRWHGCDDSSHQCARLDVPLDRSGAGAGSVSLHVVRAPPRRHGVRQDGVTLLFGGEPGEAATTHFTGEYSGELLDTLVDADRTNRVVVLDLRGTGGSGALRCRDLQAATPTDLGREAEACATLLGARRGFYRTSDSVADIEALRVELGVERLTLVTIGYGAYVAQRYALAYPDRVERLVLDSPVDAAGLDPLMRDSLAAARRVLPLICGKGCRSFTRDPAADTERLIGRMGAGPLRGYFVGADGRRRPATLTPQELLFTFAGGDADIFSRSDYPAAVVSALRRDTAPLFRLKRRAVSAAARTSPEVSSAATRAAVLCEEVRFPWAWRASPEERAAAALGSAALLTGELARPFGAGAAIRSDLMRLCRRWPTASAEPPPDPGPMPDVPVLVLVPVTQIRAPLETARRTAQRFPRSQLLAAPVLFGTPLTGEESCTTRALKRFLAGRTIARRCGGRGVFLRPGQPLPTSLDQLRPVRGVPGRRGQVLRAVERTFSEWSNDIYSAILQNPAEYLEAQQLRGGGLRGGRWAIGDERALLDRFEFIPGVRISIAALTGEEGYTMKVDGPGRLDGRLAFGETDDDDLHYVVRGRIGGKRVRARLTFRSRLIDALGDGVETSSSARPGP